MIPEPRQQHVVTTTNAENPTMSTTIAPGKRLVTVTGATGIQGGAVRPVSCILNRAVPKYMTTGNSITLVARPIQHTSLHPEPQ
jgi:hypothetical protein